MLNLLVVLINLLIIANANASDKTIEHSGDIIQVAIPLTAITAAYFAQNENTPDNLKYSQFIKSFAYGLATVHALKIVTNKSRPNFTDNRSFPSGHAFAAFSGASYINSRFGYAYGIPAFVFASWVGYSRINVKAHFAGDVLAGASIAFLFNQFFTDEVSLKVAPVKDGAVVQIQVPWSILRDL